MTTTIELDRTALETEYRALMGLRNWAKIDRRWSAKRLAKEIADRKVLIAEQAARKAEQDAAETARKAALDARAAARGTFEEFAGKAYGEHGLDEDEKKLAYIARRQVDKLAPGAWEARVAKFAEELVKHPAHTLQWSHNMFTAAAEYELAKLVKHIVEKGHTYEVLINEISQRVIQGASSPARSTSPTSNLMEQEKVAKMADLIRDWSL